MDSVLIFIFQCAALFIVSTTIFDVVHFMLHRWQRSRFKLLRTFSGWHQVHHDFLDKQMQVHPELSTKNILAHLIPEYLTSVLGTLVFFYWLPAPVLLLVLTHTVMLGVRIWEEGVDMNHMASSRIDGRRGVVSVNAPYHAMHHINPLAFYSSFINVFDMVFGTALAMRGKRVLITGASGAFGGWMYQTLEAMGAIVDTQSVTDITANGIDALDLSQYDFLVMCHGMKSGEPSDVWRANSAVTSYLGDAFIASNRNKLVPPEIWNVGSEAEVLGFGDYAMSKRYMADYAAQHWFHNPDVTYRHIVPSAFTSRMGWGLMTAKFAVSVSIFLIRRGFRYIPVTYTGLAFLNRLRFTRSRRHAASRLTT